MNDAHCPEPKPTTLLLLTAAGAVGFTLGWMAYCGLFLERILWERVLVYFLDGAGVGLAAGVSVCISHRLRVRSAVALIMGIGGGLLALNAYDLLHYGSLRRGETARDMISALGHGGLPAIAITFMHHVHLLWKGRYALLLGLYAVAGAVSSFIFACFYVSNFALVLEIYGLLWVNFAVIRFLALLGARALDRKMHPRPAPPPDASPIS